MTSPICNPSFDNVKNNNNDQRRIERIVFIHMRKAGGSTLRGYLKKVSNYLGLEYVVHEGSIMPRTFFLPSSAVVVVIIVEVFHVGQERNLLRDARTRSYATNNIPLQVRRTMALPQIGGSR